MAVRKNRRMTFEDHKQLGSELRELRERLIIIAGELWGRCPKAKRDKMFRGIDQTFSIRDCLESQMFRDFPKEGTTRIYFGPADNPPYSDDSED